MFHAQQCVEKSFKAILEKMGSEVPKTHDVIRLFALVGNICSLEIDMELLQEVSELYIETRYPGDFGLLQDGKPTLEEAKTFFLFARDVYETVNMFLGVSINGDQR